MRQLTFNTSYLSGDDYAFVATFYGLPDPGDFRNVVPVFDVRETVSSQKSLLIATPSHANPAHVTLVREDGVCVVTIPWEVLKGLPQRAQYEFRLESGEGEKPKIFFSLIGSFTRKLRFGNLRATEVL